MQQIRIIGSTATGWHRVDTLTTEALLRFASVEDVHFINVSTAGVVEAPPTFVGLAKCSACPFSMADAFIVLRMIRHVLREAKDGPANRCG